MHIHFNPEAKHELREAKNWYERQRKGLGIEFVFCVDEAIEHVQLHPEMYPVIQNQFRRSLVRKFPFSVIYEIEDSEIHILAIFHSKRNPAIWQKRKYTG